MNAIEELRNRLAEFSVNSMSLNDDAQYRVWLGLLDRIEDEYMELPRDKDGEVINVGDTVTFDGIKVAKVIAVGKDYILCVTKDRCRVVVSVNKITSVKPDTWKQILADTLGDSRDYCSRRGIIFADAYDAEAKQELDLIRRCKSLAGVEQMDVTIGNVLHVALVMIGIAVYIGAISYAIGYGWTKGRKKGDE